MQFVYCIVPFPCSPCIVMHHIRLASHSSVKLRAGDNHDLSLLQQLHSSQTDHIHGSGWLSQNCKTILEHSPAKSLKNLKNVSEPRGKFCIGSKNLQCGVPVLVLVNEWRACVECWCTCSY